MKDINGLELDINDIVMYINNKGLEFEGIIMKFLDAKKIEIRYNGGTLVVKASETYLLGKSKD